MRDATIKTLHNKIIIVMIDPHKKRPHLTTNPHPIIKIITISILIIFRVSYHVS